MSIILNSITASLDGGEKEALAKAKRLLGEKTATLAIRKKAVDARRRDKVCLCFSVEATLFSKEKEKRLAEKIVNAVYKENTAQEQISFEPALSPVIAGFGPAGIFCALSLARMGARPIVIERGADMDTRVSKVEGFWHGGAFDSATNVQFGEGGAGTFSDGKLTTGINDPLCAFVLEEFVKHGADERILTQAHPHVGTDAIRRVVRSIREEIISLGGRVYFETSLKGIRKNGDKICAVVTDKGEIETDTLVLAIGHSARDTFEMLLEEGFAMERKPFSAGVRVEQKQSVTDAAMYGRFAGHSALPPAEYKLSRREGERGVYSFCMCPGGYVVASASEEGGVVTNGMSYSGRDGENSNSAIVVSVLPSDFEGSSPLAGMYFQRELEKAAFKLGGESYFAPCQNVRDFVENKKSTALCEVTPTYMPGVTLCDMNTLLPKYMTDMLKSGFNAFDKRFEGFMLGGVMTGVETRTSSPVRILRGEDGQAAFFGGVYPCGEGAGYAGGIMSAACDGLKIAEKIAKKQA